MFSKGRRYTVIGLYVFSNGGACPDYTVGDARFVLRLHHSSFYFHVTLTVADPRFRDSEDRLPYRSAEFAASPDRY